MCRPKSEGGRRCPRITAAAATTTHTQAAAATARTWLDAQRDLREAEQRVNGGPLGTLAVQITGPLARQAAAPRPEVYDEQVAQGRQLVRNVLIGRGHTPEQADQMIDRLVEVYTAWTATPEDDQ